MLFALVVASLVSLLTASVVVLAQGLRVRAGERQLAKQRAVAELAREGAVLTPRAVARALDMPVLDADRLLRSMVDDVHFTMAVDDKLGELRFWFTEEEA